jgi:hypothetical protein
MVMMILSSLRKGTRLENSSSRVGSRQRPRAWTNSGKLAFQQSVSHYSFVPTIVSFKTEGVGQWAVGSRDSQCSQARGFEFRAFFSFFGSGKKEGRREEDGGFFG